MSSPSFGYQPDCLPQANVIAFPADRPSIRTPLSIWRRPEPQTLMMTADQRRAWARYHQLLFAPEPIVRWQPVLPWRLRKIGAAFVGPRCVL